LNTELYIARKMFSQKKAEGQLTKPILRITMLAIALGIAVMLISIAVLKGFQGEITKKISGFGAHIQIKPLSQNSSPDGDAFNANQSFVADLKNIEGVVNVQAFATKPAIIKADEEIEGVLLKGIDKNYNWNYFKEKLVSGRIPQFNDSSKSNDILLSAQLAAKLKLKLNENVFLYFIQQPPRMRKLNICGIYKTGLEEFDTKYAFADIAHIQKLNDWGKDSIAGYEILIDDFNNLEKINEQVSETIPYDFISLSIKQVFPQLFDWLNLQDMNVVVILIIMTIVCVINMISGLLIIILERTQFIGMLKSMGASNWMVRKIFIYHAVSIVGKGMLWGNIFGIGLCALQYFFHIIKLDEASYYVSYVPVMLDPFMILAVNIATLLICTAAMLLPSLLITKITPIKAIRFS